MPYQAFKVMPKVIDWKMEAKTIVILEFVFNVDYISPFSVSLELFVVMITFLRTVVKINLIEHDRLHENFFGAKNEKNVTVS